MVTPFWILSTCQKLPHYGEYSYDVSWSLMKETNFFLNPPFFYFHGNCSKVCPTDSDFCGLSRSTRCGCERKHYCKTLCEVWSEFNIFCTLVTMAMAAILNFFNPSKAATHYGGYSYKVSWSLMKGIQKFFKSPLFCFHDNCGKVCPTDSDFCCLSRSTRCECCSYQVSSISVWRVTCYDHFCVFQFFSILAISMLKKSNLNSTTSHGIWYSYKVS